MTEQTTKNGNGNGGAPKLPDERQLKRVTQGVHKVSEAYAVKVEKDKGVERYTALLEDKPMERQQAALKVIRNIFREQTSRPTRKDRRIEFSADAPHITVSPRPEKKAEAPKDPASESEAESAKEESDG